MVLNSNPYHRGARAASAGPARYLRAVFPGGVSIRGTTFRGEARPKQATPPPSQLDVRLSKAPGSGPAAAEDINAELLRWLSSC